MSSHNPSPDELEEWQRNATRRRAILPRNIQVQGRDISLICGNCDCSFTRKLLPNRNDPVFVCPQCKVRNYAPIEW